MRFVFIGLSITSSWGNGHATTYRALIKALTRLGNHSLFLERDVPYYASNRDMPSPEFCEVRLYNSLHELKTRYAAQVNEADVVVVGSYTPEGVEVGKWVTDTSAGIKAFYDIDTPVTMAKLENNDFEYLEPGLISRYDLYLSFTGGPVLRMLENKYGSPAARDLYCSVDESLYFPEATNNKWDLGYLGTYSIDRQPTVQALLCEAAMRRTDRRFVVAGPLYPESIKWPENVERIIHLPPSEHRKFYNSQRYTLNVTRADMIRTGFAPSVRLFEASACGVPIISDYWEGLDTLFKPDEEILIAHTPADTLYYLKEIPEEQRLEIGRKAREKTLKYHTADSRARQLENYAKEILKEAKHTI